MSDYLGGAMPETGYQKHYSAPYFDGSQPCRTTDPELWFPEPHVSAAPAKQICSTCEFRMPCVEYAIDNNERYGIYGGMSVLDRDRLSGRRPPVAEKPARVVHAPREGRRLSPEEIEQAHRMTERGWSAAQIGLALGINKRSVVRLRAEMRAEAAS